MTNDFASAYHVLTITHFALAGLMVLLFAISLIYFFLRRPWLKRLGIGVLLACLIAIAVNFLYTMQQLNDFAALPSRASVRR